MEYKTGRIVKYPADDLIYTVHEHDLDLKANSIYLVGREQYVVGADPEESAEPGIEYTIANRFIKNLNILKNISSNPILIHMKTCGGLWEEGMAIYDAIKSCPNYVTILNYTHARSMSSLIFQAADKRVMMPHSCVMYHYGTIMFTGLKQEHDTYYEEAKKAEKTMLGIYVERMQESKLFQSWSNTRLLKFLRDNIQKKIDVFLTPEQALAQGFADEIFGANGVYDWEALKKHD